MLRPSRACRAGAPPCPNVVTAAAADHDSAAITPPDSEGSLLDRGQNDQTTTRDADLSRTEIEAEPFDLSAQGDTQPERDSIKIRAQGYLYLYQ
jgi:hypothetical protein